MGAPIVSRVAIWLTVAVGVPAICLGGVLLFLSERRHRARLREVEAQIENLRRSVGADASDLPGSGKYR